MKENDTQSAPAKKKNKAGKIVLITLASIVGLVVVAGAIFYGVFFNEINAVMSIRKVDENVYYMEYRNNYYFDEFLEKGAENDNELIAFITSKLLKGLPIEMELPNFGCSAFTATTAEGDKLFARNYDFDFNPILITKTFPKNAYKSIATTDLKALGFTPSYLPEALMDKFLCLAAPYAPFDGINEKGVVISVNMINGDPTNQDTGKVPFTTTTMIRLVLDKADSVEKAIELIGSYEMHDSTGGPFHFQVADRSGDSAVIEYIEGELQVTRKAAGAKYLAMTNFVVFEDYSDGFGQDRYEIITEKLDSTEGVLSESESIELLEDAKMEWTNSVVDGTPSEDGESGEIMGGTMWSNIFNLTKNTMTFYSFSDFENKLSFSI